MLTIKILGPANRYTDLVEQHTRTALRWARPHEEYRLLRVSEPDSTLASATPALVINDQVCCAGRIPSPQDIVTWLADAQQAAFVPNALPSQA